MNTDAEQRQAIARLHFNLAKLSRAPRVLIVEDDDRDAELLRRVLVNGRNVQVVIARNGNEAVTSIKDGFDLVFLDLIFPDEMSGLEILDRIKSVSNVPVLVVTGASNYDPRVIKALVSGAAAILPKPLQKEQIDLLFGTP